MAEAYFKDELASYIGSDIELGMQSEMTRWPIRRS